MFINLSTRCIRRSAWPCCFKVPTLTREIPRLLALHHTHPYAHPHMHSTLLWMRGFHRSTVPALISLGETSLCLLTTHRTRKGPNRPKTTFKRWTKHHSRPLESFSFNTERIKCDSWCRWVCLGGRVCVTSRASERAARLICARANSVRVLVQALFRMNHSS